MYADLFNVNAFGIRVFKRLGIILGASVLDNIISKATVSNRQGFIIKVISELKTKDRELYNLETSLNIKLKAVSR